MLKQVVFLITGLEQWFFFGPGVVDNGGWYLCENFGVLEPCCSMLNKSRGTGGVYIGWWESSFMYDKSLFVKFKNINAHL